MLHVVIQCEWQRGGASCGLWLHETELTGITAKLFCIGKGIGFSNIAGLEN